MMYCHGGIAARVSKSKEETHAGKQCIKVPFPRACTPKICGIMTCQYKHCPIGVKYD